MIFAPFRLPTEWTLPKIEAIRLQSVTPSMKDTLTKLKAVSEQINANTKKIFKPKDAKAIQLEKKEMDEIDDIDFDFGDSKSPCKFDGNMGLKDMVEACFPTNDPVTGNVVNIDHVFKIDGSP